MIRSAIKISVAATAVLALASCATSEPDAPASTAPTAPSTSTAPSQAASARPLPAGCTIVTAAEATAALQVPVSQQQSQTTGDIEDSSCTFFSTSMAKQIGLLVDGSVTDAGGQRPTDALDAGLSGCAATAVPGVWDAAGYCPRPGPSLVAVSVTGGRLFELFLNAEDPTGVVQWQLVLTALAKTAFPRLL